MAFDRPGPWQYVQRLVSPDGRPTPDFLRWLNAIFRNDSLLDDGKQDADADLDALATVTGTGLLARTGDGAYATRTLTGGAGVTITNPDGVSGNPLIEVDAVSGSGAVVPLVDGSEPPVFITDGAGNLIFVPWSE